MPTIGLGTALNTDPETCKESVRMALEMGYRMIDTAQMYGNEGYVGGGIRRADVSREEVFLATKIGPENNRYDDVHETARESFDRLGVEYADILYLHWPTKSYDPQETLRAFDELYDDGLIEHVGLSNFTTELIDEAGDALGTPIYAHQAEMHPLLQQEDLLAHAQEHDYYLVAYSPLAKGAIFDDPDFVDIADQCDLNPAQLSLAWLSSKENVVVIPKSETETHLRENLEAVSIELDNEIVSRIDALDKGQRIIDIDDALPEDETLRWTPEN